MVAINGYAGTAADWDPTLLQLLGEHFRVILVDPRGLGESTRGDLSEPLTVATMADDVEGLCAALGVIRPTVMGWSMGGFVAQSLALLHPDLVSALVLASTDPGGPEALRADPDTWARLVDHSGTPREQASRLLGLLFPPHVAAELDAEVGELVAEARAALDPGVLTAQEAAMEQWHSEPQQRPTGDLPLTLVACGAEDVVIPPDNSALVAARWSADEAHVFDRCGHAFMAQEPSRFVDLVCEHLL